MTIFSKRVAIIPVIIACFALTTGLSRADNDYMVEKGDTLIKIGKLLGVPYEAIMKANGLKNTTIFPDQILRTPSGGRQYESEVAATPQKTAPVAASKPAEASPSIVATPVAVPVENSNQKKETVSRPSYSATAYIPPVQGASKSRSAYSAPAPNPSSYVVQPGDSILSISRRFGITPWHLRKANNIKFAPIYEGLVLQVPKRSNADMASL